MQKRKSGYKRKEVARLLERAWYRTPLRFSNTWLIILRLLNYFHLFELLLDVFISEAVNTYQTSIILYKINDWKFCQKILVEKIIAMDEAMKKKYICMINMKHHYPLLTFVKI